jgi:3-phenylpropionate/cinnamic acid dioxygenase small subunit
MLRTETPMGAHILDFLIEECAALDEGRYSDWLDLLTDEFVYEVPVPHSREDPAMPAYGDGLYLAHESKSFLSMRFQRIKSDFAWAERPTAFVRHFVSNLRVHDVNEQEGFWSVSTNVLVTRSRLSEPMVLSSAQRRDDLVRTDTGWKLARRVVLLDTELPTDDQLAIIY